MLALLASPDPNSLPPNYSVEILFEERLCIVVGNKSPLAHRRRIDFAELSRQPWIIGPFDTPGTRRIGEMFHTANVEFPKRYVATFSGHLRFNMAATGRFVSVMPELMFHHAARRYGLKMLPLDVPAPRWPAAAVTLRNRNLSPVVDLFMKCAREVAKSHARLDARR